MFYCRKEVAIISSLIDVIDFSEKAKADYKILSQKFIDRDGWFDIADGNLLCHIHSYIRNDKIFYTVDWGYNASANQRFVKQSILQAIEFDHRLNNLINVSFSTTEFNVIFAIMEIICEYSNKPHMLRPYPRFMMEGFPINFKVFI